MNSIEMKDLFHQVFACNGENTLHDLVVHNKNFASSDNWFPYGGKTKDDRSNFGTFENQQSHSGAALVEKITNSIDALLLKRCKQKKINPKSDDAPKTMEQATERFFEIPNGDIGELLNKDRAQMARDNIQIIASGNDENPDLIVYDYGEGQHPDNFKNTFLSIANNNKTDIPFVQGKYNMGSTGAVVFCGKYRYQLIASKMDQVIFDQQKIYTKNLFGWTIVRRHILTDSENLKYGSSWYEYFAINGKRIPQFEMSEIDIGLFGNRKFTTGSFIKLYSYEMPRGAKKNPIHPALTRELNQLLYKPGLPIWLYEKRKKHKTKKAVLSIAVYGNHVRINNPDRPVEFLEQAPIYEYFQEKSIGEVTIQAIVFKKGVNQQQQLDRKRNYIGSGRNIIYTLNGQVQGNEGQSFITKHLKYNFLKDTMLIVIDCSRMKTEFRQDLFMANRSNLRQNNKLDQLRDKVIEILKSNEALRRLNTQRKNAILHGGNDKEEKELIENLLSKVPLEKSLLKLLKKGIDLVDLPPKKEGLGNSKTKRKSKPFVSKRFPSIFKISIKNDKSSGRKVKSIPLMGKGFVKFETNVESNYFYRPQEKGEFIIQVLGKQNRNSSNNPNPHSETERNRVEDVFEVNTSGPSEGTIKLTLKPKDILSVGDEIKLNAKLTSPDGDFNSIFYVRIVDPKKEEKKPIKREPEKPDLPKLIKITKVNNEYWQQDNGEQWNENNWDESSIIQIIPGEDGRKIVSAIAINMDSISLKKFLSKNNAKTESDINYLKNQYVSKIYLHGLFLFSILDKLKSKYGKEVKYAKDNQSSEDLLAQIFKDYGSVLIHLDINKEILNSLESS